MVIERRAFVKEQPLGPVEIFGARIRVHGPPAKGDQPPTRIPDGKGDPITKKVIGAAPVVRLCGNPRLNRHLLGNTLFLEVAQQRISGRRKPDLKPFARLGRHPTFVEIGPCARPALLVQAHAEKAVRRLVHLGQFAALVRLLLRLRVALGDRHAHLTGEDFNRLHKGHVFGLPHKGDRIPFRMAAKAIVKPLFVIDMEGGGFLVVERAWRPHVALAGVGFLIVPHDLAPDHLGQRQARAQLV